jgi:hypothetical protein
MDPFKKCLLPGESGQGWELHITRAGWGQSTQVRKEEGQGVAGDSSHPWPALSKGLGDQRLHLISSTVANADNSEPKSHPGPLLRAPLC